MPELQERPSLPTTKRNGAAEATNWAIIIPATQRRGHCTIHECRTTGRESRVQVLIVGLGAGAACGMALAGSSLEVLALDRAHFPRDKICGDALPLAAQTLVQRLGLPTAPPSCSAAASGRAGQRQSRGYDQGPAGQGWLAERGAILSASCPKPFGAMTSTTGWWTLGNASCQWRLAGKWKASNGTKRSPVAGARTDRTREDAPQTLCRHHAMVVVATEQPPPFSDRAIQPSHAPFRPWQGCI